MDANERGILESGREWIMVMSESRKPIIVIDERRIIGLRSDAA